MKEGSMIKKRPVRVALLACACVASLGLVAGVSPAAAKKKVKTRTVTQTATFNQCVSVASPISGVNSAANPNPNNPQLGVGNLPVTIPPYRGLPQDGAVTGISQVGVRISHTFNSDLGVLLVAPGARAVPLALDRGGNGDGYGTGATSCGGSLVQFSDAFGTPIGTLADTDVNPILGQFKPEQPLAALNGSQARGNWQLLVTDGAGGDDGSLNAFSLTFTYTYLTEVKVKVKKKK
jgi:subtilisin-like proprotein convertase family protein